MLRVESLFVIAAVLQVIVSEPPPHVPPHCKIPPPDVENPQQCCNLPPIFAEEDLEACGIPKVQELPPRSKLNGPPDCTKQQCIMTKNNLLKGDEIDFEAVGTFLDKWAEKNPEFKPAVETAKGRCLGELPGPPQICKADKMVFCIGSTIFLECPTWEDNENCAKVKNHIESCKAAAPL